jgi:hypothetical protein
MISTEPNWLNGISTRVQAFAVGTTVTRVVVADWAPFRPSTPTEICCPPVLPP